MSIVLLPVAGFLAGVLVNLLADYLPAQRHYVLARHSPFSTVSVPKPYFFPHRQDGGRAPVYLGSGLISLLTGTEGFRPSRTFRRVAVEIGLAGAFGIIGRLYGEYPFFPFYLAYAAIYALCAVTDIEHRWLFPEVMSVGAAAALLESLVTRRVPFDQALVGGLVGFAVFLVLHLFGRVFNGIVRSASGKAVGRTVLGFGDAELAAMCGLTLGASPMGLAALLTLFSGGAAAVVLILGRRLRGKRYRRFSAIPYAPHILIGAAALLYFPLEAYEVLTWLTRLF